jgi:hypothetical protein
MLAQAPNNEPAETKRQPTSTEPKTNVWRNQRLAKPIAV